jgi:TetR/AcrR family transcriptional regulator
VADGSRRTAILAAAKAEFGAHGYSGARIERIASAAAVNKQLLFHYFDSKDGLYIAAVSALLADFPRPTPPGSTPSEALKWMAAELVTQVSASPGLVRVLADRTRGTATSGTASPQISEWLSETAQSFSAIVVDGQKTGFFRDDLNPQDVANTVVATAIGVSLLDCHIADGPGGRSSGTSSFATVLGQMAADYCAWR